ncbi:MAG TPA: hypothetical protein VFV58_12635 [Blastocatellia bacterium]|jgi:hypothetical protein|nr:hypothetical protein [Blastocatellia bacterium]
MNREREQQILFTICYVVLRINLAIAQTRRLVEAIWRVLRKGDV